MKIKISTDSTSDLTKELIEKHDIGITPLCVVLGGKALRDGIDVTPTDIFEFVGGGKGACGTAAVNVAEYAVHFRECLETADAVVHINISSEISVSHQNALIAASELDNVYVVDSRQLSTGCACLVLDAVDMAEGGMDAKDIKAALEERIKLVETSFVIDTLAYLRKGGRCSPLQALGANVLGLKPCIEMIDGKMDVGKKYRGAIGKCITRYVEDRLKGRDDINLNRIFITHSITCKPGEPDIVAGVKEQIASLIPFEEIIETPTGCTISSHCGPNTLGILFERKA